MLSSFNRARASRLFSAAAGLSFLFAAAQAHAHARLISSTPAANGTVAPPSEIRLEFSEGVEPRFSGATLSSAAGGGAAELGAASVEAGRPDVLIVPIAKPLMPGIYTVHWHAVSADTHRTQGTFKFTLK